ncbi:MAG: cation:dicarboxylase symporter family transporter [candidate division Zixibacteria bacterium]|nr:cation:dicarboxylase symporter family transporter [candidate division Zixibacteria bacterium]
MTTRTIHLILVAAMIVGAVLGGILGYLVPDFMLSIAVIGQLFLGALKLILIPLIISVIVVGISSLGDLRRLGRAARTTILYFLASSTVAVGVGLALAYFVRPGENVSHTTAPLYGRMTEALNSGLPEVFSALAPANMLQSIAQGQYLGLVILALLFGAVLVTMGKRTAVVINFFKIISEASMKLVSVLLYAAPLGLFVLVGSAVAVDPNSVTQLGGNMAMLGLTLLGGILIHGLIILPLMLKFMGGQWPGRLAGNLSSALLTALGTGSSAATLPVTYDGVIEKHKVDARAGSLVLPLGTMINLNGTAMYLAIAAIFVAQLAGVSLSAVEYALIGLLALVLSFGASGVAVPATGPFMLAMLMGAINYPVAAFGALTVLVVVDVIFERGRALLNVWGTAVGAVIVGESFEFKTARGITPSNKGERGSYDRSQRGQSHRSRNDRPISGERRGRDSRGRDSRPQRTRDSSRPASDRREGKRPIRGERPSNTRMERPPVRGRRPDNKSGSKPQSRPSQDRPSQKRPPKPSQQSSPPKTPVATQQSGKDRKPSVPRRAESTDKQSLRNRTESRSDREPRTASPVIRPEHATSDLSPETVERERTRIAAQLAEMRHKEERVQPSEEAAVSESITTQPQTEEEPKAEPKISPVIDFYSGPDTETPPVPTNESSHAPDLSIKVDSQPQSGAGEHSQPDPVNSVKVETRTIEAAPIEVEKQVENNLPDSDDKAEEPKKAAPEPAATFGRSRTRRGPARTSKPDSKSETDKPPLPAYNTENISFGRSKRKRTR